MAFCAKARPLVFFLLFAILSTPSLAQPIYLINPAISPWDADVGNPRGDSPPDLPIFLADDNDAPPSDLPPDFDERHSAPPPKAPMPFNDNDNDNAPPVSPPTTPTHSDIKPAAPINLYALVTERVWGLLFPNLRSSDCEASSYYKREAFIKAAQFYRKRGFLNGTNETVRLELAAFLAQTSHETSGGWYGAEPGPNYWGYCYSEGLEKDTLCSENACDKMAFECKCSKGKKYFGRGPFLLKWNYNYAEFSLSYFGNYYVLDHPDVLSDDPVVGFASAIWYWMKPGKNNKSCHDHITNLGRREGAGNESEPGFGLTTEVLNEPECQSPVDDGSQNDRVSYYQRYLELFGVTDSRLVMCGSFDPEL